MQLAPVPLPCLKLGGRPKQVYLSTGLKISFFCFLFVVFLSLIIQCPLFITQFPVKLALKH